MIPKDSGMALALLPAIRTIITHFFGPKSPPRFTVSTTTTTSSKYLSFLFRLKIHKLKTFAKPHSTISRNPQPKQPTLILNSEDQRFLAPNGTFQNENSGTTIAAIVTSIGGPPAAVGIARLSGASAVDIASSVFRPMRKKTNNKKGNGLCSWRPASHVVDYGVVLDHEGNVIDEVLVLPMLASRSYTREDVVELQCHGSEVCLFRVLRACLAAGARLAEPA